MEEAQGNAAASLFASMSMSAPVTPPATAAAAASASAPAAASAAAATAAATTATAAALPVTASRPLTMGDFTTVDVVEWMSAVVLPSSASLVAGHSVAAASVVSAAAADAAGAGAPLIPLAAAVTLTDYVADAGSTPAATAVSAAPALGAVRASMRQREIALATWRGFAALQVAVAGLLGSLNAESRGQVEARVGPPPLECSPTGMTRLSFWVAAMLPITPDLRRHLLASASLGERLWIALQLLWQRYGEPATGVDTCAIGEYVECGDRGAEVVHPALRAAAAQQRLRQ